MGERANVSVRVLPVDADARGECGVEGFEVLEFGEVAGVGTLEAKVFVEGEAPGRFLEDLTRVERVRNAVGDLLGRTLGEGGSRELIERLAVRWERRCGVGGVGMPP